MELVTSSPFGDSPHTVVALACGMRGCRATTPCIAHEQVVIRFRIDGQEPREAALLSKAAFFELTTLHRDPRELFAVLADLALLANQPLRLPPLADAARLISQGGIA